MEVVSTVQGIKDHRSLEVVVPVSRGMGHQGLQRGISEFRRNIQIVVEGIHQLDPAFADGFGKLVQSMGSVEHLPADPDDQKGQ